MLTFLEFFIYVVVGLLAGFLSGLLGVGGGMVVVPSLLLIFHWLNLPFENVMQIAIGTSLAAMIFTSGTSAWSHYKNLDQFLFKALAPGICFGCILGAFVAHLIPTQILQMIFAVLMLIFGVYFLLTANISELEKKIKPHYLTLTLIGFAIGFISSILGIGGGAITVPLLLLFGTVLRTAISTSAVTGFLISIVGALAFLFFGLKYQTASKWGYIYLPAFLLIGLAAAPMATLGAKYAYTTSSPILKRIFGCYLLIVGGSMIWFS